MAYPPPTITFRVNNVDYSEIFANAQPDAIPNIIYQLKHATIWIEGVSQPLKYGDVFTLSGDLAKHVKNLYIGSTPKVLEIVSELNIRDPLQEEGLLLLFDPRFRDSLVIDPSNSTVTQWTDLIRNVHLTNSFSDPDKNPTYVPEGLNGIPVLAFDGFNDSLANSGDFVLSGSEFTLFAVASNVNNPDSPGVIATLFNNSINGWIVYEIGNRLVLLNLNQSIEVSLPAQAVSTIVARYDGTDAALWVNGGTGISMPMNPINAIENIWIGSLFGTFLTGNIAYIAVFDAALSFDKINRVLGYINAIYGNYGDPNNVGVSL